MKADRMIELLEIEKECVSRTRSGCDRNCAVCDLVQDDNELIEMYTSVIDFIKKRTKKPESRAKHTCICGRKILETWCGWKGDTPYYKIVCPVCNRFGDGDSEIAAIRAWNQMILSEREKTVEK